MSMVPPTPQKRTFWQGLGDLLRDPQFMSGLQNFSVGMTEHPDPGFHARQGLAINQNLLDTEEQRFRQREHVERKQAEARRQAFVNQMMAPPPGPSQQQRASGVDPTYRPPGMAPAPQGPLQGMAPSQQQYIQQLARVDPAAAMKLVTQHQFREPAKAPEPVYQKGQDGRLYLMNPPSGGTPQPAIPGVGPKPPEKPSERDRKIKGLVDRGIPRPKAADIVDGRLKAITDPVTGTTKYYNLATGEVTVPGGQQGREISKQERARLMDEKTRVNTTLSQLDRLEKSIDEGVGFVPAGKDVATGIIGQIPSEYRTIPGVGEVGTFPEASKARTDMKLMAEAVIQGLAKNPRVPVYEMQRLKGLLNLESLATSPEQARQNIAAVREYLISLDETATEEIKPKTDASRFDSMTEDQMRALDISTLTPAEIDILEALWEAKGYGR